MRKSFDDEGIYNVVMKLFNLYSDCTIGADELFLMVEEIMEPYESTLFETFKNFVLSREHKRRHESWFCRNIKE